MISNQLTRLCSRFIRQRGLHHAKTVCCGSRNFHIGSPFFLSKRSSDDGSNKIDDKEDPITAYLSSKYKILSEDNAPLILDVDEERRKLDHEAPAVVEEDDDEFAHLDLSRGVKGVFDIEQLVSLLHTEGAIDLFVCEVPKELCYADHIVIVTGRSVRHRLALAQLVRKVFKRKMNKSDIIPRIEGDGSASQADWLAMDLGNIILHVFSRATRNKYDLESLWCLGSQHDPQSNQKDDDLLKLLASSEMYLDDLEPAEPTVNSKAKEE